MFAILVFFQLASPNGGVLLYTGNSQTMTIEECISSAAAYNKENAPKGSIALCAPATAA